MSLLEQLFTLLAPHDCICCGSEGALLCRGCAEDYLITSADICFHCQTARSYDGAPCATCHPVTALEHVWATAIYDGAAKRLVHTLKFDQARAAAQTVAAEIAASLPHLPAGTIISAVPTVPARVRQRGFDHAVLIARALARQLGLPYNSYLVRSANSRQLGASRTARFEHMSDAFRIRHAKDLSGQRIVLVDDVFTTGATLEAAAALLVSHGAHVDAAVFARTM